jgi:signal peptidase
MKKVLSWISNIIILILILVVILSIVSNVKGNNDYVLDYLSLKVLSGSMEPDIKVGDVVVVKKVDGSDIKAGDVVTYKIGNDIYVTHRVVEAVEEDGKFLFKTKGDANNKEDDDWIKEENLVGKLAFHIPKAGYFVDFVRTPIGFVCFFVAPISILIGLGIKDMNVKVGN